MIKLILTIFTLIITSFYYFPFWFVALPAIHTKMLLAIIGIVIFFIRVAKGKRAAIDKDFLVLSVFAGVFSLICFFAVTFNGTADYAYATYIASMWVWLSGAYMVCWSIRRVHGVVSIEIIAHYLITVCVIQCCLALCIDMYAPFKTFIDTYIEQGQGFLNQSNVKRLYGIGAMLDTAGIRFSIVLVLLAYLLTSVYDKTYLKRYLLGYILSFIILTVVGNMIARTTIVGSSLGLLFIIYRQISGGNQINFKNNLWLWFVLIALVSIPIVTYFYRTNPAIHKNIRFGFEGFFNLVETGAWKIGSNETLERMIVFPATLKTWIIGDGYFNNPINTDPHFTGEIVGGYYMGTDIGYLRFIFYCGLVGLIAFSAFICKAVNICIRRFPEKKNLLILLLVLNFIVWFKVSTDIFLIFSLFLIVSEKDENVYNEQISSFI